MPAVLAAEDAERLYSLAARAAAQPEVRAAVEANHDDNRWWPKSVGDWRVRMTVAGWSTRVSYSMVSTYGAVVAQADALGWDGLTALDDRAVARLVHPLGLPVSRVGYLRSLAELLESGTDLLALDDRDLIRLLAMRINGAGYKVAQCAALYARGYHCGIIPVDSGMVSKLAPFLGLPLSAGPVAHEEFRELLQASATSMAGRYRDLALRLGYRVHIPEDAAPTWLLHLVLIYFKRLYLNRPGSRLCPRKPACAAFLDCRCAAN
ncbi:MAG TPA: hypothetical protein VGD91_19645 [Trebonia sp.]